MEGDQGRRPRRRDDGRRHRLRLRPRRHGGRAQGRRGGERREGQVLLRGAARQGDRPRPLHRGEEGRAARPDHGHRRPGRPRRLRPGHRGRLRGPLAQAQGLRRDRRRTSTRTRCCAPTPARCRSPSSPRAWTGRRTSSACTSSRPSTRCRWSRSSRARRPPTRRSPRPTTSCSRSRRRRSSSTTAAASTPRGSSASWSTRAWRCSPRACTPGRSSGPPPRPATRPRCSSSPTSSTSS